MREREKRPVQCEPQCSRTVLGQCSSCNQALWSYKGVPMRFGTRDLLPLEEIRRGYNTLGRSSENVYVIPVNRYIAESHVQMYPHVSLVIELHSCMI